MAYNAFMDEVKKTNIYNSIRDLLSVYSPPFDADERKNVSGKDSYSLISHGDFVVDGRKRSEMWFAGLIKQKDYVGFYFMPVYSLPEAKEFISPRLLKTLKGKSCFYIKTDDAEMLADIKQALAHGLKLYQKRGWV